MSLCLKLAIKNPNLANYSVKREAIEHILNIKNRIKKKRELLIKIVLELFQPKIDFLILWFLIKYKYDNLLLSCLNFTLHETQRIKKVDYNKKNILINTLSKNKQLKEIPEVKLILEIFSLRSNNLNLFLFFNSEISLYHINEAVYYGSFDIVRFILNNNLLSDLKISDLILKSCLVSNSVKTLNLLYTREPKFQKVYLYDSIFNQSKDYVLYFLKQGATIDLDFIKNLNDDNIILFLNELKINI